MVPDSLIATLLERLRSAGGDTADIEVKAAAGGLPASLTESLCALSNLPTGGWVILGLDERSGFAPVPLGSVNTLKQGLAAKARSCDPPVRVTINDASVDGFPVVIATAAATASSARPCRVRSTGSAWMRSWDGDIVMSALEEQAFLAARSHPDFDQREVTAAGREDLDSQAVASWKQTATELDPLGLGRFSGEELLFRGGIIGSGGVPTRAGLLALGVYPQQFIPRFVINLAVQPEPSNTGVRAVEATTVTGPIPVMLDAAMAWAAKVFARDIRADGAGALRDHWQYPLEAFRELIANALVHRDLDEWSYGEAIEVRLTPDVLRVTNPGGLYGITVDRLGLIGTTSARNARLLEICRYARTTDGARVVETLATGIPRVLATLRANGLPTPSFHDTGIRFTAILRSRPAANHADALGALGTSARIVYSALVSGEQTVTQLAEATSLQPATIRKALRTLAARGLAEQHGGRGQHTVYLRT
jgi:ATP-dependent DNA helicase RecG